MHDINQLPLRCCKIPIDTTVITLLLPRQESQVLLQRIIESESNSKMHCPTCTRFINLDVLPADNAILTLFCDCGTELCTLCQTAAHPNYTCEEYKAGLTGSDKPLFSLAQNKGWKQCPKCLIMIEFVSGCIHMTCIHCKHEFCYGCLQPWRGSCSCGMRIR